MKMNITAYVGGVELKGTAKDKKEFELFLKSLRNRDVKWMNIAAEDGSEIWDWSPNHGWAPLVINNECVIF